MPSMISSYFFHRILYDGDYDELRRHLTVLYCNRLPFLLSNTTIPTASGIYVHIYRHLRRMYNSLQSRRGMVFPSPCLAGSSIVRKWRVESGERLALSHRNDRTISYPLGGLSIGGDAVSFVATLREGRRTSPLGTCIRHESAPQIIFMSSPPLLY